MVGPGPLEWRRQLYGRRKGPALTARQSQLLREVLPRLSVPLDGPELADPMRLFDFPAEDVWLEIGFGGGEHLTGQAKSHPRVGFIGCEAFLNGVSKLVTSIAAEGLSNIRILHGDARDLIARLGASTIGRVFLLFPDPWPKRRHGKRRFANQENLSDLHRIMKPGAFIAFASDSAEYVTWTLGQIATHGGFEPNSATDDGEVITRYEMKARAAGREISRLRLRRLQGAIAAR